MSKKPGKETQLRATAEAILTNKPKAKLEQCSPEQLLHELQVSRIELETQNEELRQTQNAMEESRDLYVDLYEFAPVGYITLTREGLISEINFTAAKLLGAPRNKLLHHRFSPCVAARHRDLWDRLFVRVFQHSEIQSCELSIEHGDGYNRHAHVSCICVKKEGAPPVVRVTLSDITYLRQAEETMREWQQFVDCAHWGMIIGRADDRAIKQVNPAYARMHGYTMEELRGIKTDSLFAPESRANLPQYNEYLRSPGCYTFECVRLRKDGSTFPAIVDVSTIETADGETLYIANVTDTTERKQMERQLRELAAHLQTAREEEKASIAREVHDDLGGTLTALKMEACWMAEELDENIEKATILKHIESMVGLIDDATNVTRRIITGLRPCILDDLGLLAALEWQAKQFHKHTGIECRVNFDKGLDGDKKLDKTISINLFRIFQEALTNVSRHSRATKVAVEFHYTDKDIMLSISDNGCGLPDNFVVPGNSYGILGMTERVQQLGGKIKFDRPPGGGYAVTVIMPLPVMINKEGKNDSHIDRRRPRYSAPGIGAHPGETTRDENRS